MQVYIVSLFFFIYVIVFVSPSKSQIFSLVSSKEIVKVFRKDLFTLLLGPKNAVSFNLKASGLSKANFYKNKVVGHHLRYFRQYIDLSIHFLVPKLVLHASRLKLLIGYSFFANFKKELIKRFIIKRQYFTSLTSHKLNYFQLSVCYL